MFDRRPINWMHSYAGLTQRDVMRVLLDGNWDEEAVVIKTVLGTRLTALRIHDSFTTSNGLHVWLSYDGKLYAGSSESRVKRYFIRGPGLHLKLGHALARMVQH